VILFQLKHSSVKRRLPAPAVAVVILAFAAGAGCSKRQEHSWPEWTPTSIVVVNESREELPGGQANVKLVIRGEPSRKEIDEFLRNYIDEHRRKDEEMWVAVFLEGMDVQSIEYAFAIARPGEPIRITVRDSAQTYR
jgi:hypothetical protein